ncbi:unnamed protein product [Closterium sp. Yama58-4]|nr:unnamed protein product [Closterium sp. Yama58-4]
MPCALPCADPPTGHSGGGDMRGHEAIQFDFSTSALSSSLAISPLPSLLISPPLPSSVSPPILTACAIGAYVSAGGSEVDILSLSSLPHPSLLLFTRSPVQTLPQATAEVEISEVMQLVHFDFSTSPSPSSLPFSPPLLPCADPPTASGGDPPTGDGGGGDIRGHAARVLLTSACLLLTPSLPLSLLLDACISLYRPVHRQQWRWRYQRTCSSCPTLPVDVRPPSPLSLFPPTHFLWFPPLQTRPQATVEVEISEDMQLVHFDFSTSSSPSSLPFSPPLLPPLQTRPQATVEVEISEDMQLVHFDFSTTPFELHDDSYVLRAMGLCTPPLTDVFPPSPAPAPGAAAAAAAAAAAPPLPSTATPPPPTQPQPGSQQQQPQQLQHSQQPPQQQQQQEQQQQQQQQQQQAPTGQGALTPTQTGSQAVAAAAAAAGAAATAGAAAGAARGSGWAGKERSSKRTVSHRGGGSSFHERGTTD